MAVVLLLAAGVSTDSTRFEDQPRMGAPGSACWPWSPSSVFVALQTAVGRTVWQFAVGLAHRGAQSRMAYAPGNAADAADR